MLVEKASVIFNNLKGLICVYKPAEVTCEKVRKRIINSICTGLNEMEQREPMKYVQIEGDPSRKLHVNVVPNLADNELLTGPQYQFYDLRISWSNYLGNNTSGVLLFGIGSGTTIAKFIRENRPTRAYRIKGMLGQITDTGFKGGKVIEKTTWKHVHLYHLERLLSTMQASHQKKMFEMCGVDMQSQLAYELAVQGPIRPANSKIPIIYGIKCVHFEPPEFTIEVQCVNENESYLKMLMHEIGIKLHSSAHCVGIQCIRHSHFTLDNTLLNKHLTLQNIYTNMEQCNAILEEHNEIVRQKNVNLQ